MAMQVIRITHRPCLAPSLPRQLLTTSSLPFPLSANPPAPTAVSPPPSSSPPPTPPPTLPLHPVYHLHPTPPVSPHRPLRHRIQPAQPRLARHNTVAPALAPLSLVPHHPCCCQNHSAVRSPIATRVTSRQTGSSTT